MARLPTVITLDVMMPDLDGWSVLTTLRQDPELADIPVIMVTIVDEQRRSIALGAAGYLSKPIDRERLHQLICRFRAAAPPTRVLVVEDDAPQRERMLGWLAGPQWSVQEATNGREALDRLRQDKPDVILLDLMMPEMDGFAVVAALQKEAAWRDIPVVVITAREPTLLIMREPRCAPMSYQRAFLKWAGQRIGVHGALARRSDTLTGRQRLDSEQFRSSPKTSRYFRGNLGVR